MASPASASISEPPTRAAPAPLAVDKVTPAPQDSLMVQLSSRLFGPNEAPMAAAAVEAPAVAMPSVDAATALIQQSAAGYLAAKKKSAASATTSTEGSTAVHDASVAPASADKLAPKGANADTVVKPDVLPPMHGGLYTTPGAGRRSSLKPMLALPPRPTESLPKLPPAAVEVLQEHDSTAKTKVIPWESLKLQQMMVKGAVGSVSKGKFNFVDVAVKQVVPSRSTASHMVNGASTDAITPRLTLRGSPTAHICHSVCTVFVTSSHCGVCNARVWYR